MAFRYLYSLSFSRAVCVFRRDPARVGDHRRMPRPNTELHGSLRPKPAFAVQEDKMDEAHVSFITRAGLCIASIVPKR